MRNTTKTTILAAALLTAALASSSLYAQNAQTPSRSPSDSQTQNAPESPSGSMGHRGMMDGKDNPGGMMGGGSDGMKGMMNMMTQMSRMMDHCSGMMQSGPGGSQPNDQRRKNAPEKPDGE